MATVNKMRPEAKATAHIIQSGNSTQNARKMQEFIRTKELRRNQIISLTSNETEVEDGDHVLTLFYRETPIANDSPLDNILFDAFDSQKSWEEQLRAANAFKVQDRDVNVIGVSRTPKNIGAARLQTIWYTNEQGSPDTSTKLINRGDGKWDELAKNVLDWLNEFVAPHQLVSVSFFEEMHPNTTDNIGAIVTHKSGANPVKLSNSAAANNIPSAGIYTMQIVRDATTQGCVEKTKNLMNLKGGQEGHVVTTTNDSSHQDIFCVLFSWSALFQDAIEEDLRPASCGCTIF